MANDERGLQPLPGPLEQLVRDLAQRGYTQTTDESGESGIWRRVELRAPGHATDRAVRIEQDRGLWDVAIRLADAWFSTYDVLLAVDGAPHSSRTESYDERRATTLAVVDRLPGDAKQLALIQQRLADYRDQAMARYTRSNQQ